MSIVQTEQRGPFFSALFQDYHQLTVNQAERIAPAEKHDGSVVTALDRAASALVMDRLRAAFPADGILSEEAPQVHLPQAPARWVLDPIDGTASFVRGYPCWGLGVGLLRGEEIPEGYLYFPLTGDALLAPPTSDATGDPTGETSPAPLFLHNGQAFSVPAAQAARDLHHVVIGSTLHRYFSFDLLRDYKVRNYGTNLFHLACLALGRADLMICQPVHAWDLVAGLAFTRRRGMVERYLDGQPFRFAEAFAHDWHALTPGPLVVGPAAEVARLLRTLNG